MNSIQAFSTTCPTEAYQKKYDLSYFHQPQAYKDKSTNFYGLNYYVDERVYVPNAETELMAQYIIDFIRKNNLEDGIFVDVGTGCGNLAITLAKQFPKAQIIAVDISREALAVAEINIKKHKVTNIELRQSNLISSISEQPDIVVGNLPWGDEKHLLQTNTKEALSFMPKKAIFAPDGIIGAYVRLVKDIQSKGWQTYLIIETGLLKYEVIKNNLPKGIRIKYEQIPHIVFNYSVTNIYF